VYISVHSQEDAEATRQLHCQWCSCPCRAEGSASAASLSSSMFCTQEIFI